MNTLLPAEAANLANHVYAVESDEDWGRITKTRGSAGGFGLYKFDQEPRRIKGVSGGRFIQGHTGFGFLARGSGARQGEALVAIRGTASLADGLTDANCGFDNSPSGYAVHRGFSLTHKSIQQEISEYFQKIGRNVSRIHVVGHSLGGAVATLAAEQLALAGHGVTLYTFGSPRVGYTSYANALRQMIGAENIHRVYHETDLVSMVPIYPFTPVPNNSQGHCLPWNGGFISSLSSHLMKRYIDTVSQCSWRSLPQARQRDFFKDAETWLNEIGEGSDTVTMFSAKALRMIMKALRWIINKIINSGSALAQLEYSGGAIVVDLLSYLLYSGCLLGVKVAGYVSSLIKAIMQFMGRTVSASTNITVAFIRWVLNLFVGIISTQAAQAVHYASRMRE